jgi:hypothetical protein
MACVTDELTSLELRAQSKHEEGDTSTVASCSVTLENVSRRAERVFRRTIDELGHGTDSAQQEARPMGS